MGATIAEDETARETRRLELAKSAAGYEAAQAEAKKLQAEVRSAEEAEKARLAAFKESMKALHKRRGLAQSKAQGAGLAIERLRQEFVPIELRQELSAAGREERAAALVVQRLEDDLIRGRDSVLEIKDRARRVPADAPSRDVLDAIKRAEAAQVARESDLVLAKERHEAAKAVHAATLQAHSAAMAAARAL